MGSRYEVYLCDDAGVRIVLLNFAFMSYARTVTGYSNCTVGLPFDLYQKQVPQIFKPDWRVDIWRSPMEGAPSRREKSFFLRKYIVYTRQEDGVRIIELFGRDAKDILRRQYIDSWGIAGTSNYIDDLMKYVVSNYLIGTTSVPTGELTVESNASAAPLITVPNMLGKNVLAALDELNDDSETMNFSLSSNPIVYFDMIEDETLAMNGFGYRFRTYTNLRGTDRTAMGNTFSIESGNINNPNYYEDHLDAYTVYDVFNNDDPTGDASASNTDQNLSRWNYTRAAQSSSETDVNVNQTTANTELAKLRRKKVLNVEFVNSPGSLYQPRSLYGVDWDLGDKLPVKYAGQIMNVEIKVVYVSLSDTGEEKITGHTSLGE